MANDYTFGLTSFKNFVWLKGGDYFRNPRAMDVEMIGPGAYGVEVWDLAGSLAGKGQRSNDHGGWASFDFHGGTSPPGEFDPIIPNGDYKIRLTNLAPGTRQARQGVLHLASRPWDITLPPFVSDVVQLLLRLGRRR